MNPGALLAMAPLVAFLVGAVLASNAGRAFTLLLLGMVVVFAAIAAFVWGLGHLYT